jgi:hypothetical protein
VSQETPIQIRLAFDSALEHSFCAVRVEACVVEIGEIRHVPGEPTPVPW